MNQRVCFFGKEMSDFQEKVNESKSYLLEATNKFRPCLLIENKNENFFKHIHKDGLVRVYEILTHAFTYVDPESPSRVDQILVVPSPNQIWVGDIDIWIGLSEPYETQLKKIFGYMFFQSYEDFFEKIKEKNAVAN